jgi:hypothetical protein
MRTSLLAALAWLAASPVCQAAPCALTDLHWMAGVWRTDEPTTKSEERWVIAPNDRLMGSSWDLHTDKAGGVVEAETIQADGAGVIALKLRHFSADLDQSREEKSAPMVFAAARCEANTAVFDGQGEHAGEHITYHRAGDDLIFTGDFLHDGKPVQVVIDFKRAGD